MNPTVRETWDKLADAQFVHGELPAVATPESPWFVRLMLGCAGWLAAFFMLGFIGVGLAFIIESGTASLVAGIAFLATAWWVFQRLADNEFFAQFALAVSFTGQALVGWGLAQLIGDDAYRTTFLLLAAVQMGLAWLMDNPLHRNWSGFAALVALYIAGHGTVFEWLLTPLALAIGAGLWWNEFRWPRHAPLLRHFAFGWVVALLTMDLATGVFRAGIGFGGSVADQPQEWAWTGQVLSGAVLVGLTWKLLHRLGLLLPGREAVVALLGSLAVVLASLKAPGIAVGLSVLLLGFAHGNRILGGVGAAALLTYASTYYYQMDVTLLAKSQVLAVTGGVLLALYALLGWLGRTEDGT